MLFWLCAAAAESPRLPAHPRLTVGGPSSWPPLLQVPPVTGAAAVSPDVPDATGTTHAAHRRAALAEPLPYDPVVQAVAADLALDAALLHAVIRTESGHNPKAVSRRGAIGLMQVMPQTGARFGHRRLADPKVNVLAGATYLRWLLEKFDDDLELALAAYNAGEGAVLRHGRRMPPYQETREYVRKVMSGYRELAGEAAAQALAGPNGGAGQPGGAAQMMGSAVTGPVRAQSADAGREVAPDAWQWLQRLGGLWLRGEAVGEGRQGKPGGSGDPVSPQALPGTV
ncbi:lytic transglycosylase domain-containing protein [Pandoraea terrae]|nr:lytic transglycosylase domain-containing protein [Pandoraea terrae]